MAMSLKCSGFEDMEMQLDKLGNASLAVAKLCLYEGARVVADQLKAAVASIPTEEHHAVPNARNGKQLYYMTDAEKAACIAGVGIAKFDASDDKAQTAVGFNGYQTEASSSGYPRGIPVPMLMRSVEGGSSVRAKNPVCRKAFRAAESGAVSAMAAKFEEIIGNITN